MNEQASDAGIVQLMSAPDGTVYFVTFEMRQPQNQQQTHNTNNLAGGQASAAGGAPLLVPIAAVPMDPAISATFMSAIPQGNAFQTVVPPANMMRPTTSSADPTTALLNLASTKFVPNNNNSNNNTNQSVAGHQSSLQQQQQEHTFTSTNSYQVSATSQSVGERVDYGSATTNSSVYDVDQQQELSVSNDDTRTMASINRAQHLQPQYSAMLEFPTNQQPPQSQSFMSAATFPTNGLASTAANGSGSQRAITVYTDIHDEIHLSNYQCLLRKQVEFFEAGAIDIGGSKQGRNRPIEFGQLGIRCRHCAMIPPKLRTAAAFYFPSKLSGIYQASQHIALGHLLPGKCQSIDTSIRRELHRLKQNKSSPGSGREYWAKSAREKGVVETEGTLRLLPMSTMMKKNNTSA